MVESTWKNSGSYELNRVDIVTFSGQTADIKNLIKTMNIYEDMFGVFMSADIVFNDSMGYTKKLPLLGNEMVVIEFSTPGISKVRKYEFYIYKMDGSSKVGPDSASIVSLKLCSLEILADSVLRMSKSVKGIQSDIVQGIYDDQFKTLGKSLLVEKTRTEISLVIPSLTPINTICLLASTSISLNNETASYVFFESINGYNFCSVESLKRKVPVCDFVYNNSANNILESENQFKKIFDLKQSISPNTLSYLNSGVYGSKAIYHDPINKEVVVGKYEDSFNPTLTKKKNILPDVLSSLSTNSSQYTTYRPINNSLYNEGRSVSQTITDTEGYRRNYFGNMLANKITIVVNGNTLVTVGDVVNIVIKSQSSNTYDESISGSYLVSCICHSFSYKGHFMTIECLTDGYQNISGGIG